MFHERVACTAVSDMAVVHGAMSDVVVVVRSTVLHVGDLSCWPRVTGWQVCRVGTCKLTVGSAGKLFSVLTSFGLHLAV